MSMKYRVYYREDIGSNYWPEWSGIKYDEYTDKDEAYMKYLRIKDFPKYKDVEFKEVE